MSPLAAGVSASASVAAFEWKPGLLTDKYMAFTWPFGIPIPPKGDQVPPAVVVVLAAIHLAKFRRDVDPPAAENPPPAVRHKKTIVCIC